MEKTISIKEIGDKLISYATHNGNEPVQVFNDFLRFSCDLAEVEEIVRCKGMVSRMAECKENNPLFFECFGDLCGYIYNENKKGLACDGFGELYESLFQISSKASNLGQFFTPMDICELMAELALSYKHDNDDVKIYNDCASGSGRTMLAAWEKCDKYGKNYFSCQDIDPTSVMMCALNFMINGMIGSVECQNTLSGEWYFGYIVNSVKVPFANNMVSLRRIEDKNEFMNNERIIRNLMSSYNAGDYRPK